MDIVIMRCRCAALQSYLQPSASALYAAKAPALDRSRVFALFFWRRLPVLDLTEGDIGKQLSELIGVARAFLAFGASRQIGPC
jgi:hypothetical protein